MKYFLYLTYTVITNNLKSTFASLRRSLMRHLEIWTSNKISVNNCHLIVISNRLHFDFSKNTLILATKMKPAIVADEMFPEGAGPYMDVEDVIEFLLILFFINEA